MSNLKNPKDPSQMTEAELDAEIAQLQAQEAPGLKDPNQMTEAEIDAEIAQLQADIPKDDSSGEAAWRGTLQGLSFNMEEEVRAAANTAVDLIQNPNAKLSDTAAIYRRYKDIQDAELRRLQQDSPNAYMAGEIVGSVGTTAFGGPLAKLAGNTLKSAIAAGTLSAVGRADSLTDVSGIALGGAAGAAGFGLGSAVGAAAGRAAAGVARGTRLASKAVLGGVDDVTARSNLFISALGVNKDADFLKLNEMLERRGVTHELFMQDMLEDVATDGIKTPRELREVISDGKYRIWESVDKMYNQVDDAIPEGVINTSELAERVEDEIKQTLLGKTPEEIERAIDSIAPVLRVAERTPLMKLSEAQALKNRISHRISNRKGLSDANQVRMDIERVMRETLDEKVEANLGAEAVDTFRVLKRKYANHVESDGFIKNAVAKYDKELNDFGLDTVNLSSRVGKLLKTNTGMNPTKIVGALVNVLRSTPPQYEALAKLNSLNRIITKMEASPGKYAKHANRIVIGASRSTEDMVKALGLVDSEMELEDSPIQRTTADVMAKAPQIVNILNDRNPELAKALEQALESGDSDAIDSMLSSLSRVPEGKPFFAPGVGMNGKAVTDMDITETISTIKQVYSTDPMKRAQELEKFNATKKLPDFTIPGMTQEDIFIQNKLQSRRGPKAPKM